MRGLLANCAAQQITNFSGLGKRPRRKNAFLFLDGAGYFVPPVMKNAEIVSAVRISVIFFFYYSVVFKGM